MMFTVIFKCLSLENGNINEKDILILPLDLTDRSGHEAATKAVLQEFGKVSNVCNCRLMICFAWFLSSCRNDSHAHCTYSKSFWEISVHGMASEL